MTTTAAPPAPPRQRRPVRAPRKTDQAYVSSTWLKQMADVDRDYSRGARWGQAGKHVDMVMERADTRALIWHVPQREDDIVGWIVFAEIPGDTPVVHFVYVRRDARERGIAAELLAMVGVRPDTDFVFTCRGPMTAVMRTKYRQAAHMPLADFLGSPRH